jgi:predicted DCC family thiol-disulfide oxidoreductase YuxK
MSREYDIEVFFDGGCPLCRREINLLRRWDRRQRIRFTDIDAEAFDPAAVGKTREELMAEIHARLPDGSVISGVEVFRRLYSAVGFRWLVAPTRLPGISCLLNVAYRVFARNRLKLTGRCSDGACAIPAHETATGSGP